jgi:predicted component of type VI protein secretion system
MDIYIYKYIHTYIHAYIQIGGNILGAKVADYYLYKVKSSYFLIPALFTIPAALFLLLAVNVSGSSSSSLGTLR